MLAGDMDLVHAVLAPLQDRGFVPIPVFCDGDLSSHFGSAENHPLHALLSDCGKGLSAIWYALAAHSGSGDDAHNPFATYGVPVF